MVQESGAAVHDESLALATCSNRHKKNDARNFWHFNDIPVVAWLLVLELILLISARCFFGDGV